MEPTIKKKTAENMGKRILKLENINARDKRHTEKEMNEEVRKIIEEEIRISEEDNYDN